MSVHEHPDVPASLCLRLHLWLYIASAWLVGELVRKIDVVNDHEVHGGAPSGSGRR